MVEMEWWLLPVFAGVAAYLGWLVGLTWQDRIWLEKDERDFQLREHLRERIAELENKLKKVREVVDSK